MKINSKDNRKKYLCGLPSVSLQSTKKHCHRCVSARVRVYVLWLITIMFWLISALFRSNVKYTSMSGKLIHFDGITSFSSYTYIFLLLPSSQKCEHDIARLNFRLSKTIMKKKRVNREFSSFVFEKQNGIQQQKIVEFYLFYSGSVIMFTIFGC